VNNKLADKIASGLVGYLEEIELQPDHRVRLEISAQLRLLVDRLRSEPQWEERLQHLKQRLLPPESMREHALTAWTTVKTKLLQELSGDESGLSRYLHRTLDEMAARLTGDVTLQEKIDKWLRYNGYRYVLRNRHGAGKLISETVGNWQGRELSGKMELEVGRDLQFIRINGTVVGGLVGLLIYTLTRWIA
jgi:uncharacterized membrane-anchored protein YjiN (DUF445 family)